MIKYYESERCYYKIDFNNREYDVIYKHNLHIYTGNRLPRECDISYFTTDIYKEITEEQYNYMLEL